MVDLSVPFGTSAQSAYAMTYVFAADERVATFLIGGDDDVRLWVNGQLVHEDPNAYPDHPGPGSLAPVTVRLRKGRNVLLVKVSNEVNGFCFYLRPAEGSIERGLDFARVGLWGEAAAQLRPALDRLPPGGDVNAQRRALALFLLLCNDETGFLTYAHSLVATYGSSDDPSDINTLCYAWLFSAKPSVDGDRLVRLAQMCYERNGRNDFNLFELAVARYRAGKFEDAIGTLSETPIFRDWPLLAMAHHRLGHGDEARTWLAKATDWYDSEVQEIGVTPADFRPHGDSWWNQAQFELLYREAMRHIESPGWIDRNRQGLQDLARERVNRFAGATSDLDLSILSRPEQPQLHLARARILAELHRDREAEADLDWAVGSKPVNPVFWKRRARIHVQMGRPSKAAEDIFKARRESTVLDQWWTRQSFGVCAEIVGFDGVFAELVRLDPYWNGYWDARLFDRGRQRLWGEAATDAAEAVARGLNRSQHLSRLASLQAWIGDRPGLRESCRKLLATYGAVDGSDRYQVRDVAVSCLLMPDLVDDLGPVRRLAELGVTVSDENAGDHHSFLIVRALLDYRAGDFDKAAERLESLSLVSDDCWTHVGRITLALAHFKLGREAEARRDFHKASEAVLRSRPRLDRGQRYDENLWPDWVGAEVLLHEAEAVILDPAFPVDPFAF
ncbi:tetratricopeptide repeat protein, partial [Singulisphaera rosea]